VTPAGPLVAPPTTSTELVPTSRRALREAERSAPASRRARPSEASPAAPSSDDALRIAAFGSDDAPRSGAGATDAVSTGRRTARRGATASAPARPTGSTAPSGRRAPLGRRIAEKAFPPVVMLAAASLLVGTSVPANALFDPDAPPASMALSSVSLTAAASSDEAAPEEQVLEAEVSEDLAATAASRDEWSVTSYAELLRLKYGNRDFSYSTTGTGAVRWPFPYAVPISSGFGERVAPCRWCSSYHQGIDFNPGAGTPIYAIADGVVLQAEYSGGFGQHALIEHTINGQRVVSVYAHMIGASSPLVVGQTVEAGDFVGLVGSTGTSTGAHLHFEIRIDDIPIDPFDWLTANAS
jgi:murein DD-endopeptidase MepM/ murein hydrolase activator NlpD